jgi:tripartite-type tricarboxylate transporter receptor subunit TctC
MYGTDYAIVTGKDIKVEDLLSKKVNLGIPGFGTGYHAIALAIQQRNSQLEIIPIGSDSKAIPSLINKDIDAYIASGSIAKQWTESFSTVSNILDLPFGKKVTLNGLTLQNFSFAGILVSKNASQEQKAKVNQCIDLAVASLEFKKETDRLGLRVINSSGAEATRITNEYFRMMKKHGL